MTHSISEPKETSSHLNSVRIEQFSHEGHGVARVNGKATFIEGTLPGELVTYTITKRKKDFDLGKVLEVIEPSPNRQSPICNHFELCGGCSFQHVKPEVQIKSKQTWLLELLKKIAHISPDQIIEPIQATTQNYRNRARLSVRNVSKKNSVLVGFREKGNPRFITDIEHCPVLNKQVDENITALRQLLSQFDNKQCIAQIELAIGDDEAGLIFRNLNLLTENEKTLLRDFGKQYQFKIYLQPKGPDSVYLFYPENSDVYLNYQLKPFDINYKFHPTDFTQVNPMINIQLVEKAVDLLNLNASDRVLDLFCGLGNFSLPLARSCQSVLGVEGSQTMVERATMNASLNQIKNVRFQAFNLEDETFCSQLESLNFNKLLIDPPRVGAKMIVTHMDKINPEIIVYVSCNPATLSRDAEILVNTHGYRLKSCGVLDMFPHTTHVESIAVFTK